MRYERSFATLPPGHAVVCFDTHRRDGRVTAIFHRGRWHSCATVELAYIRCRTAYHGVRAKQPRFYVITLEPVILRTRGRRIVLDWIQAPR